MEILFTAGNFFWFRCQLFFFFRDTYGSQDNRERGDHLSFSSTTSTRSRISRHFFVTLHVRWLSHVLNRTVCIYQIATRWDLPPFWITISLTDVVMLIYVYLLDDLILGFFQHFETGNRWTWARIVYHPCIRSEPTNQVC